MCLNNVTLTDPIMSDRRCRKLMKVKGMNNYLELNLSGLLVTRKPTENIWLETIDNALWLQNV